MPLAWEIGLGPHVDDYGGTVRRPGGESFRTTPARVLSLDPDMGGESRVETLAPLKALWSRVLPKGCVEVYPLRGTVIGPLTDAVVGTLSEEDVYSSYEWIMELGTDLTLCVRCLRVSNTLPPRLGT